MNKIRIGTCVPGGYSELLIPHFIKAGFECMSLNFHMVFDKPDIEEYAKTIMALDGDKEVKISSIGYYCNALQFEDHKKTLEMFIDNAHLFGTNIVTTFAGALEGEPVENAYPRFKEVFGELAKRAESKGVKLAIENCPMDGTWQRATCNIGFNPKAWENMFNLVDSDSLGLEWEPAHQMVQLIEPLPQIPKWIDKIFHVHGKDVNIYWDKVREYGVYGAADFAVPRTPGFGDTDWRKVFTELYKTGYSGDVCVEGFHDPIFDVKEGLELDGQLHALNYLRWCRGGDYNPDPWKLPV